MSAAMVGSAIEIPARRGKAAFVAAGQTITVINTHGEQVVDTWAFCLSDLSEFMSNEHTRAHSLHLVPRPGDTCTNDPPIRIRPDTRRRGRCEFVTRAPTSGSRT